MFARGTQGCADESRSLRQEAQDVVETMGPKFMTPSQLTRLPAVSAVGHRGQEQAASVAGPKSRQASPKGGVYAAPVGQGIARRSKATLSSEDSLPDACIEVSS